MASVSTSDLSGDDGSSDANSSDCKLVMTINEDKNIHVGDEFDLKINVKNTLNKASNVVVDGSFFDNFEVVSVKQSKGDYIYEIDEWDIGDLKNSESATLTLRLKGKKAGNFGFSAKVTTDSNNLNKQNSYVKTNIKVVAKEEPKSEHKNKTQHDNKSVENQSSQVVNTSEVNQSSDNKSVANQSAVDQSLQTANQSDVQDNQGIELNGLLVPIGIIALALIVVGGLVLRRKSK